MKSSLKAGRIKKIFITHLHGDHLYGLSGLLCTISQSNQRTEPVSIYGPLGLAKYLRVTLGLSRSELCFRYQVIEIVPTGDMCEPGDSDLCNVDPSDHPHLHPCEDPATRVEPQLVNGEPCWPLLIDGPLDVVAGKLDHRIPSFGFIINERNLPGSLSIEKLRSFGLEPGPICKRLRLGETVDTAHGESISMSDVLGADKPGRKVVICGDSCESSSIASFAMDADVFVHEATLQNDMRELAVERGHSTPEMAAQFAMKAKARRLILTHFSQRYTESSRKEKQMTVQDLLEEAIKTFGQNCSVAEDLMTFPVKRWT